ncbi:MAG TPA: CcdB family protein [Rhodopila sp.]|nr:CcdB family protein [Rhodopila sp.]
MARFDVHPTPGRATHGFVLEVQADLLSHLATRAVVPLLRREDASLPIRDLNPSFEINGESYVMLAQAIASVPVKELGATVASLKDRRDDITRALDILLAGF